MNDKVLTVNDREYTFDSFSIYEREIQIEVDDTNNILSLQVLNEWYKEGLDHEQGIDPNYKKNITIESNNENFCFERCWVRKRIIPPDLTSNFIFTISYDFQSP